MPVIYNCALADAQIVSRANTKPPTVPTDGVLACWPLTEEKGKIVKDSIANGRDGEIINNGTWMIGGPGFNANNIPPNYNPDDEATMKARGHALRLASDDLYQCDWPVTHQYTIPSVLPPGIYAGYMRAADSQQHQYATFVVRRADEKPVAPIAVLCATNTWMAYNDTPFDTGAVNAPAYSFYASHAAGQPTFQLGLNLPCPIADPYRTKFGDYSHLVRAERFLHVWLEQNDYHYDTLTDYDLHSIPGVLSSYQVLFIAGHSEYWSLEAYHAVKEYLEQGGHVIVASGNTIFWRVSYEVDTTGIGVIECRKIPEWIASLSNIKIGETFHTSDHQSGGLMREVGKSAWQLIGLECVGWFEQDRSFAEFTVNAPGHEFFQRPEKIDVGEGDMLGGAHAVGHEFDVSHAQLIGKVPDSTGSFPTVLAQAKSNKATYFNYQVEREQVIPVQGEPVLPVQGDEPRVISEVIDWIPNRVGRVFGVGSIAAGASLHKDPKMSALFRNALHHMGVVFCLDVLAVQGGQLFLKNFDGSNWANWQQINEKTPTNFSAPPAGIQWAPNRRAIMAVTSSHDLLYSHWDGSNWSSWETRATNVQGRPMPVAWGRNRLDILVCDQNQQIYHISWDGRAWKAAQCIGEGAIASAPSAINWEGNRLGVAVLGTDKTISYKWWSEATGWSGWQGMGGNFTQAPTMIAWGGNRVTIFAVDEVGQLWSKWWDGTIWSEDWQNLGGELAGPVVACAREGNQLSLFGIGQDGHMKVKWWDGANWGPTPTDWQDIGGSFDGEHSEPTVASYRGRYVSLLAVDTSGALQHNLWNGTVWSDWEDMGQINGNTWKDNPAIFHWVKSGQNSA